MGGEGRLDQRSSSDCHVKEDLKHGTSTQNNRLPNVQTIATEYEPLDGQRRAQDVRQYRLIAAGAAPSRV